MSELRWNPILREWVIVATHRQDRPLMPTKTCPFCIGAEEVPKNYDLLVLPNRFPSLHECPPAPDIEGDDFYRVAPAKGYCEVVLYSSEHNTTLAQQSPRRILNLILLWRERFDFIGSKEDIKYVMIFENKGAEIGVTLPHPHGQIYGYPFIPPKAQQELDSAREHYIDKGGCIFCQVQSEEFRDGRRIVAQNEGFFAFIPFFARWPYEVHIYPKKHMECILELGMADALSLASILKDVLVGYDHLFGFSMPYIMILHQRPTDGKEYPYYHFHFEFYPPRRSKDKIKYLAGCESGAGTYINDTRPEEKAAELRKAIEEGRKSAAEG